MNNKERILLTVEQLIAQKNVNSFSIKDITDELKISKGTVFYYYKSKDDIILDIMQKHFDELSFDYFSWLERHKEDILNKERFLEVIFYKGVELFNKAKMHIYLINECASGKPQLLEKYNSLWESWVEKLIVGIKQTFPEVEDPNTFAFMLMLIIDGLTIRKVLNPSYFNKCNLINEIIKRW